MERSLLVVRHQRKVKGELKGELSSLAVLAVLTANSFDLPSFPFRHFEASQNTYDVIPRSLWLSSYREGIDLLRSQDFEAALRSFEEVSSTLLLSLPSFSSFRCNLY